MFNCKMQPFKQLKDYATSKKDMKKGVEIVPEENYRLRNEDLYPSESAKIGSKTGSKNGNGSVQKSEASMETAVESY